METFDFSKIETKDLVNELKSRGYKTELIFGLSDVERIIGELNNHRSEEIVLDDSEKKHILDDVFSSIQYYVEEINGDITGKVIDYIHDKMLS